MITRRLFGKAVALMSGDGLARPMNAPPAGQLAPGVQPGVQSPVVLAQYVIVYGAGGIFIYSGKPAAGNAPVFTAVAPGVTKDPYGNTVSPLVNIGHLAGAHAGWDGNAVEYLADSTGTPRIVLDPGQRVIEFFSAAGLGSAPLLTVASQAGTDSFGGGAFPAGINLNGLPLLAGFAVLNTSGLFIYSAAPAAGNLIASIAPASGTDSLGNKYLAGVTVYNNGAVPLLAFSMSGSVIGWNSLSGGVWSTLALAQIGAGNQLQLVSNNGNNVQVTGAQLELLKWLALDTQAGAPAATTALQLYANPAGNPSTVNPKNFAGQLLVSQTDNTVITVTQTTITRITAAWSIPVNDAQVGTLYRVKAFGTGAQGSTQQNLAADGNNGNPTLLVAGTTIPASAAFSWWAEAELRVTATGAGGTADVKLVFGWQQNATGTTANSQTAVQAAHNVAFNTTIAQTSQIRMNWGSATGAPTITCTGSSFERLGA